MSPDNDSTSKRRMLKSIGATGLALGASGVVAASGADADPTEVPADRSEAPTQSDGVSPEGGWEYKCEDFACCSGSDCQEYRRYCADGSCSGWEKSGCCAGDCGSFSCA
ncbi:hypothetical protein M0R88_05415 [Halorussus gelatinilyticus]|uniref:Uncharacterized protein n=1 Tax=Halorussus gelatinilyticus TaxID=2937524 RepID=A0A8U0IMA5_9EURY|nr:hypothetical protein [Halorussus gelatinilyticus]UPW01542.1 hypothetical protein M0R88_05415 [Halorussus gelatinilyticus]